MPSGNSRESTSWNSSEFSSCPMPAAPVTIPSGFTVYPKEIVPPVRHWVEGAFTDVRYWNEQPKGGHFSAFEVPALFVDDLRNCFRQFR